MVRRLIEKLNYYDGKTYFGLAIITGEGIPISQSIPIAQVNTYIQVDMDAITTVMFTTEDTPIRNFVFVSEAIFFDPCASCTDIINRPENGNTNPITGKCSSGRFFKNLPKRT